VITEGIPVHDSTEFWAYAQGKGTRIIGPNCPGLISPGKSNAGIIPADITKAGKIGLVSKSGTLTYQMMYELRDLGFSSASFLACAVPAEPEMIAPACPMVLPSGAVKPAT
jgi:succinyl-CoA synthetase alpha subunit